MTMYTVLDGELCIETDGVGFWFTRLLIEKHIAELQKDLEKWKERLAMLEAGKCTE